MGWTIDDEEFLVQLRRMKKPPRPAWRAVYTSEADNGVRDRENPCDGFEHGEPRSVHPAGTACRGDGHYLCEECRHHERDPEDE